MNQIPKYIFVLLQCMIISLPPAVIIRIAAYFINRKRNIRTTAFHEIGFLIFFAVITGIASLTLLPEFEINGSGIYIIRSYGASSFSFLPGRIIMMSINQISSGRYEYFLINLVGNIIMFIPVGFLIPLLWRCSGKLTILIGFLSSLSIELLQIPLPRCTDIDDLWMNTLGAAIGMLAYFLLNKLLKNQFTHFKVIKE